MLLNRKVHIQCLLLILCLALSQQASAQFWKREKKSKKTSTTNRSTPKPKPEPKKAEKPRRKRELNYPNSVKRDRYQIDILIPLYLDELVKDNKVTVKGKIPEKAQGGINFYEGIKLAVDTLATMGYKTDIYIHDITSGSAKVEQLIQKDSLKHTDLIIGFVPSNNVAALAKYAQSKKVNFVSAFSPSDAGIKENPYFILMNPTLQNNCEAIVKSIVKKRSRESILVYKKTNSVNDSAAYTYITDGKDIRNLTEIDCNKLPDSALLAGALDNNTINIVIVPVLDPAYAEKLVNQLHTYFPEYRFDIYGMPTWKNLVSNKKMIEWGEHISINITQPYYFDPTVSSGVAIANKYKSVFGGKATELSYRGFELVYWMTDLLNKYGAIFNEKTNDDGMAIFTKYELKPRWDNDNNFYYIENKHLYLYHYQAGTVLVEQ
jgi:hypothetical protein